MGGAAAGSRSIAERGAAPHAAPARTPMLYPELFKSLEDVRWSMEKDVPWERFAPTN